MSARLMKSLAHGKCVVSNRCSGQVRVYWEDVNEPSKNKVKFLDIDGFVSQFDLAAHIPIAALRKSKSLKQLVHDHQLVVHD